MQENLYTASLVNGEVEKSKSYEISNLIYVAFFGGIIAVSVLGIRNAKWLQVEDKYIKIITAISALLFTLKLALVYAATHELILIESPVLKIITRAIALICFIIIYFILKGPYKEHSVLHGETEPLLKPGIIWILISAVIEGILIMSITIL